MKKILSFFLAVLCLVAMPLATTAADFNTIQNTVYDVPLINTIANVQRVNGADAATVLNGENAPGIALVKASELSDKTAFISLCMEKKAIPALIVADTREASDVISAIEAASCKDVTMISSDPVVLKFIRNKKYTVRTGLQITLEKDTLTSDEAHAIRTTVRSAPATFCVISADNASRQAVSELQELALAVWVDTDDTDVSTIKALTSGANGVITADAYGTAQLINSIFDDNAMTRTPIMIGHRGNPSQAPENSLSGFLKAYENGADVFEVDVEITKDGEIVIMHDSTLNRTTNYKGTATVGDMTLEEIKSYRLLGLQNEITEETVPTFREVLEAFQDKDCRIFVEFKGYKAENVPSAMALVQEYGMEDRVDVISFNSAFLTQTQKEIPGMSTGLLQSPSGNTKNEILARETFYSSIISTNMVNSTINPNQSVMSKHYLQAATDRGMTIWPWTYNANSANMAFLFCPDGVTTDDVQWSKDMLKFIETDTDCVKATPGSEVAITLSATTYGRETSEIASAQRIVKVLDGEEIIQTENGVITATGSGTAHVLFGYKTQTTDGNEYVLYSQPVTIEVSVFTPTLIALLIAGAVLLILAVAVVIFVLVRKKKH